MKILQSIINNLNQLGGGTITLNPGVYVLPSSITIPTKVKLR